MDAAAKSVLDYGITVVGIVGLAAFGFYIVKTWTADLRASRDRALDISDRQVEATEELAKVVHAALDRLAEERRR